MILDLFYSPSVLKLCRLTKCSYVCVSIYQSGITLFLTLDFILNPWSQRGKTSWVQFTAEGPTQNH